MRRAVSRLLSATRSSLSPAAASAAAEPSLPPMRSGLPPRSPVGAGGLATPPGGVGGRLAGLASGGWAAPASPQLPARAFGAPPASRSSSAPAPCLRSGPAPPAARRGASSSSSSDGAGSAASSGPSPDLRAVPGVGLKNEILLRGAGIHCLADLAAAFHADAAGGGIPSRMVEYLQVRREGELIERTGRGAGCPRREPCAQLGVHEGELEIVLLTSFERGPAARAGRGGAFRLTLDPPTSHPNQLPLPTSQDRVGIRHAGYARLIANHVAALPHPDDAAEEAAQKDPEAALSAAAASLLRGGRAGGDSRVTLCVEGNISAGKSTFLRFIKDDCVELRDVLEVVPEPVDKWQAVGKGGQNVLAQFYADPARYAYTFQNYVFVTRMMQERDSAVGTSPMRLLERSVFSDRMVFVRAVHEARWMSDMELAIYDSWFDPVVAALPSLVPDGFIYLRASPGTCAARMAGRGRGEEAGVSLDYLAGLHAKHEAWLADPAGRAGLERVGGGGGPPGGFAAAAPGGALSAGGLLHPHPLVAEGLLDFGPGDRLTVGAPAGPRGGSGGQGSRSPLPLPAEIAESVYFLDADRQAGLHRAVHAVPALVLDCDRDLDLVRDVDAKAHYGKQVRMGEREGRVGREHTPTPAPARALTLFFLLSPTSLSPSLPSGQVKAYFDYVKAVRERRATAATAAALAGVGPPPTNGAELAAALGRMAGGLPRGVHLGGGGR